MYGHLLSKQEISRAHLKEAGHPTSEWGLDESGWDLGDSSLGPPFAIETGCETLGQSLFSAKLTSQGCGGSDKMENRIVAVYFWMLLGTKVGREYLIK